MSPDDYESFALLLEKIANDEGMSWQEKRDKLRSEMIALDAERWLEEVVGWFAD